MILYSDGSPDSYECPNCGGIVEYTLEGIKNHHCGKRKKEIEK